MISFEPHVQMKKQSNSTVFTDLGTLLPKPKIVRFEQGRRYLLIIDSSIDTSTRYRSTTDLNACHH